MPGATRGEGLAFRVSAPEGHLRWRKHTRRLPTVSCRIATRPIAPEEMGGGMDASGSAPQTRTFWHGARRLTRVVATVVTAALVALRPGIHRARGPGRSAS